jgi:hypothetical protein
MDSDNKEIYKNLCNVESTIPIFSRDWWMDAVCEEENWDVILVKKGVQVVAALPYYFIKRGKKIKICQPLLTQTNGVWIKYPDNQKLSKRLSYEKEILKEIIDSLEKLPIHSYNQNFKYNFTNWLPFYWRNYKQTTRYSYVISNITNAEEIFKNFDHAKRQNIRKAEKVVKVKYDLDYRKFYENHKMTLLDQNEIISYSYKLFSRIYNACYERNQGKVFYAEDESNNIHAALFIIWDENSAYDLISTIDPKFRYSGASNLLVYEAIKYTSNYTKVFDFEGSMIENVENSFRQFGTEQKQYFNISKKYKRKSLVHIIAKNVYHNCPWLKRVYLRIKVG